MESVAHIRAGLAHNGGLADVTKPARLYALTDHLRPDNIQASSAPRVIGIRPVAALRQTGAAGKGCAKCRGKGAIECPGCKGSGKNKKNGNVFERWKCFDCQGFGLVSCPTCGKGRGLTPEQRGER